MFRNSLKNRNQTGAPTPDQIKEFWEKVGQGQITKNILGHFLRTVLPLKKVGIAKVGKYQNFLFKNYIKKANIGWVGDNFTERFKNKKAENVDSGEVVVYSLQKDSQDGPILKQLGTFHEIKLAHFFDLLKKQNKGQKGILLVDGRANLAYIRDDKNILRAVYAFWYSGDKYWDIGAREVGDYWMNEGRQFIVYNK